MAERLTAHQDDVGKRQAPLHISLQLRVDQVGARHVIPAPRHHIIQAPPRNCSEGIWWTCIFGNGASITAAAQGKCSTVMVPLEPGQDGPEKSAVRLRDGISVGGQQVQPC